VLALTSAHKTLA